MKKFKDLFEESPAKDYVGDGESQKDYQAAGSDEQKFKDLHITHNSHLVMPKEHPVAPDYVFTGERPGGKKGDEGEDHKGSNKVPGEAILKTYKDFVSSGKSAAGDKAPVMQGSSKVKEEVELDESDSYYAMVAAKEKAKKMGKVWARMGQAEKDALVKPEMLRRGYKQDPRSGRFHKEEVEYFDEAFKKGMLKLKDGKSIKIDEKTAKMLNNAMKQLNTSNRKKMEAEAMKDKKSFDAMVTFAKAAA